MAMKKVIMKKAATPGMKISVKPLKKKAISGGTVKPKPIGGKIEVPVTKPKKLKY